MVLVAHSYRGAIITNAAVGRANVEALIYITGFPPAAGESLVQLVTLNRGSEIGPATLITRPCPLLDRGEGTDLHLTRKRLRIAFAADVPRRATRPPCLQAAFESGSEPPARETVPSWYLVTSDDRTILPATQSMG